MSNKVKIFWLLLSLMAIVRIAASFVWDRPDISSCLKTQVIGEGIIVNDPVRKDSGQVLDVFVHFLKNESDIDCGDDRYIRMKTDLYPKFSFGEEVHFTGKLNQPFNFKSKDGREFNYIGYLAKEDIFYEIKSAQVEGLGGAHSADDESGILGAFSIKLNSALISIKRSFVSNLERELGEPHSALAAGLVVGEKSALGKDLLEDFRKVGLIHIIVLSGFNITIVAAALRKILSVFPRVWSIIIGGIGMILFCIMVGGGATVIRSCLMGSLTLFADLSRRDYSVVRALSFAAIIMIIQNPLILLNDPSFQLSFLATLGLILLASPIEERLTIITDKFGIRGIVASTFATQIFVSPFILYMTGQLSIIGVLVNIIVLPIIPITMLLIFLTGVLGFVSIYVSQIFGWFTHIFLSYELFVVQESAKLSFAAIQIPKFSFTWVFVFYILFFLIYLLARKKFSSILSQFKLAK